MTESLLIFHLRPARAKARRTAIEEALVLLGGLGASAPAGGPLSERGGLFWVSLPSPALDSAGGRLARLGYSEAVDVLEPANTGDATVRWKGRSYRLVRLHEELSPELREAAPDRRTFALEAAPGRVRDVRGYRGDSRPLSRRGLPVIDARMLVNLAMASSGRTLLDPFAGAGGVVLEGLAAGCRVLSCDIDPALRFGLRAFGSAHSVADARALPVRSDSIDAIATEPPYEAAAGSAVVASLAELSRVLRTGGRLSMLCSADQAAALRANAVALKLLLLHEEAIDRKGVACAVLVWERE